MSQAQTGNADGVERSDTSPGEDAALTPQTLKPVVTLWETYGAGMAVVGPQVAERLRVPFWPGAYSSELLEELEEQREKESTVSRVLTTLGRSHAGFDYGDMPGIQQDKAQTVLENNRKVWAEAQDGGVVTGRNATVILAHRPNTLHVKLTAPLADRVRRAADASGISPDRAAKRQRREDAVRTDISLEYYGWDPREDDHYDLVLNTGLLSLDACVDIIVAAAAAKTRTRGSAAE